MLSIASLIDYFNHLGSAGSTILLALVGSGAWLFQKFISFLLWELSRRGRVIEIANALKSEIADLKKSLDQEYSEENRKEILEKLETLARQKKPRALMLAATDDNFIFESVKQELSKLPLSALGSVLAFYNANGLFLESYKRQATDLFAKSSLEDQKIIVGENYKDADSCKLTSKAAVRELEFVVAKNYLAIALIICALALSAFWIFDFLQMHLTF